MKILFGTNNPGKLSDARRIANSSGHDIVSPGDLGITVDIVEDGKTFWENAYKKFVGFSRALHEVQINDIVLITDDSGLEIPALNNEPGVLSRRWAGHEMTDSEIVDYCLKRMDGVADRQARFTGVLAVGRSESQPHYIDFHFDGELLTEPRSGSFEEGLPFRSLFYVPRYGKMLHEIHDLLYDQRKGILTHREHGLTKAFKYINSLQDG